MMIQKGAVEEVAMATQCFEVGDDGVGFGHLDLQGEEGQRYFRLWQGRWTDVVVQRRWGHAVLQEFQRRGRVEDEAEEDAMMQAVMVAVEFAGDSPREERVSDAETVACD